MIQLLSQSAQGRTLHTAVIANPAAGAEVVITVPAGVIWEPVALDVFYTAGAGGGNRRFILQFTAGAIPITTGIIQDTVAATTTNAFHWAAGMAEYFDFGAVNESYQGFIKGLQLQAGDTFGTITTNLQVGDQWSAVGFAYYETLAP